jgi:uncharacterized protein (TIGR01777 family)
MRVFITGGTGKVGMRLLPHLAKRGDTAIVLSRDMTRARAKVGPGPEIIEGDPNQAGAWMDYVNGCGAIINLVGEGIAEHRWTDEQKARLRDSRIKSTEHVVEAIRKATDRPDVLVQGSAIGYYGYHEDELLTEESPPGDDFLAKLCIDWEAAAKPVGELGTRLAILRTGVVLDRTGGALKAMLMPFKLFLFGGKVGHGRQWMSWIHHEDEVGLLLFALDHKPAAGPLNGTAPVPVRNAEMAKAIGRAMGRPSFWPTPAFLPRLALGEAADLIVKGQRVMPKRPLDLGYQYKYPDIDAALKEILGK